MRTVVAPARLVEWNHTNHELDEQLHRFIMKFQGGEAKLGYRMDAVDIGLTRVKIQWRFRQGTSSSAH